MNLLLTEAPLAECVTLAEAKAHLRMIHSADDAMIGVLITAAREAVELATGRALVAAGYTYTQQGDVLCSNPLPQWPIATIESVSYTSEAGAVVAIDAADYTLLVSESRLLVRGITGTGLTIDFHTAETTVPAALKASVLLLMADMYEQAESNVIGTIVTISPTVDRLLYPYRRNLGT